MEILCNRFEGLIKASIMPIAFVLAWGIVGRYWGPALTSLTHSHPALAAHLPDLAFLSNPTSVFSAWCGLLVSGDLIRAAAITLLKTAGAVFIALLTGSALGFVLGKNRFWRSVLTPSLEGLRTIPPVALLPVFLLLFGIDWKFGVALAVFGTIGPVAIATLAAITAVAPESIETAKNLQLTFWQTARYVEIPLALPTWFTGVRIGVSISYILVLVSEMLAGYLAGLGAQMEFAKQSFQFDDMFAYIATICLLGLVFNLALTKLEQFILFWLPKYHEHKE